MPSEFAAQALARVRDGSHFEWYVVPILVVVFYIYSVEVERRNWNVLFAGLAFWGMDWFNEIWNGLVFHFTQYAPMWATPGDSAYVILIGLNIEICMMFAFMGIYAAKLLPADKSLRIFGIPNRWFLAALNSAGCVIIEIGLNSVDALTWDYTWWSAQSPIPIFLFGYLHFYLVAYWVHDMETVRQKAQTVGAIFAFNTACLLVFGPVLGWI